MKFSARLIEQALDDYLLGAEHSFLLEEAVNSICETICAEESDRKEVEQEIEILLKEYHLFVNTEENTYTTQSEFFKDAKFCVAPSEYEINNGILIPGHRFAPFSCDSVFPSEVEITFNGHSEPIQTKDMDTPIHDAAAFHTLLGSEEMFHHFIADHQENHETIAAGNPNGFLLVTVLDMDELYDELSFKKGDALIFTVKDWDNGIFTFEHVPAANRDDSDKKSWLESFETALVTVFDENGYYTTIPEQLANAYFKAKEKVFKKPSLSIDEFLEMSENIDIIMLGGQTILWKKNEPAGEDSSVEMPEEVMFSQGETDSLEGILKAIGSEIAPIELDSFMYNELYQGGETLEPVIDRCVFYKKEAFSDDAQEAVFLNYLEERWEDIIDSYRRDSDKDKGSIRRRLMQLTDERLRFFLEAGDKAENAAEELKESLEHTVNNMRSLMAMLNSDDYFTTEEEFEKAMEGVEHLGEIQSQIIEDIEANI